MTFGGTEVRYKEVIINQYVIPTGTNPNPAIYNVTGPYYTLPSDVKAAFVMPDRIAYTTTSSAGRLRYDILRVADLTLMKTIYAKIDGQQVAFNFNELFKPDFANGFAQSKFDLPGVIGGWITPGYAYYEGDAHPNFGMTIAPHKLIIYEFL